MTKDAYIAWTEVGGKKARHWCLHCKAEGKAWTTPKPCEHMDRITEQFQLSAQERDAIWDRYQEQGFPSLESADQS